MHYGLGFENIHGFHFKAHLKEFHRLVGSLSGAGLPHSWLLEGLLGMLGSIDLRVYCLLLCSEAEEDSLFPL